MSTTSVLIRQATAMEEGAGARVQRLFPVAGCRNHDPFVLWDHFEISPGSGFPDHPHRGFEAITYLFEGAMEHADNLGNRSTVGPGGAQRFTAGRGIVHSEMPGSEGKTQGIQLWINLPLRLKTLPPAYQAVVAPDLPEQRWQGGRKRIIVGQGSPLSLHTPVEYFELALEAGASYSWTAPDASRGLVYVVEGELTLNGQHVACAAAAQMEHAVTLEMGTDTGCRIMVCFGQPHGEPIYQHGPFVD
jgi:redox-sensitive bicupin YhaK (pirin superfamily)